MTTELHELLELYCELLLARSGLLEATPCDPGLEEAVRSIIYAGPKTEIKELHVARALLVDKFGKEFGADSMEGNGVSERVLEKLKVDPPKQELVRAYLTEIARTYGINWPKRPKLSKDEDKEDQGDNDAGDGGQSERPLEVPLLTADELRGTSPPHDVDEGGKKPPVRIAPASPSTENPSPRVKIPGDQARKTAPAGDQPDPGAGTKKDVPRVGGKIPDVDELSRRFAALKR